MSDSIFTSLYVLSDPENLGISVGIFLLSCIRAEIYVMSFQLPVNGRHDFRHTQTSDSVPPNLRVSPDLEDMA